MEEIVVPEKLEITIDTTRGSLKLELSKKSIIKDIVNAVLEKYGLNAKEIYELVHEGVVLKPDRTIESYQIKSGEHLNLVRETYVG